MKQTPYTFKEVETPKGFQARGRPGGERCYQMFGPGLRGMWLFDLSREFEVEELVEKMNGAYSLGFSAARGECEPTILYAVP